jgi:ATP-dependent HslUV protease, peptidase subunit HslV
MASWYGVTAGILCCNGKWESVIHKEFVCVSPQAVVGDGQVTQGSQVMKPNARKVRRIGNNNVIVGFAGATADALTLMTRLESKIETYPCTLHGWCQLFTPLCRGFRWSASCVCVCWRVSICLAQLSRACVELAKEWRTEKYLRQLEVVCV